MDGSGQGRKPAPCSALPPPRRAAFPPASQQPPVCSAAAAQDSCPQKEECCLAYQLSRLQILDRQSTSNIPTNLCCPGMKRKQTSFSFAVSMRYITLSVKLEIRTGRRHVHLLVLPTARRALCACECGYKLSRSLDFLKYSQTVRASRDAGYAMRKPRLWMPGAEASGNPYLCAPQARHERFA